MRALNLDQVRSFLAVSETGSFSVAARRLSLTQPAVSQHIKELEARFGLRLLERLGKRAFPTHAGQSLERHGRRVLQEADLTIEAMRAHSEDGFGRVRLGTSATLCAYVVPPILLELRRQFPRLELSVVAGPTVQKLREVVANETDLALVAGPAPVDPALAVEVVRAETFLAYWPDTLGPAPPVVTPHDLARVPFIAFTPGNQTHLLVQRWFDAAGVQPATITYIDYGTSIFALVRAGVGAAILAPEVMEDAQRFGTIAVRPLAPVLPHEVLLAIRRDKPRNRALRLVHEALRRGASGRDPEHAPDA